MNGVAQPWLMSCHCCQPEVFACRNAAPARCRLLVCTVAWGKVLGSLFRHHYELESFGNAQTQRHDVSCCATAVSARYLPCVGSNVSALPLCIANDQLALRLHYGVLWRDVPPSRIPVRINDNTRPTGRPYNASSSTILYM